VGEWLRQMGVVFEVGGGIVVHILMVGVVGRLCVRGVRWGGQRLITIELFFVCGGVFWVGG